MGNTIALMYDFRMAKLRSELLMNIRKYFIDKDYLEVSTPTLSPYLIPEPTIKTFRTEFINPFMERTSLFMIPSPEIFMKKLLAAGSGSIFQISQCFRNAEQLGDVHNPEFTMLEYYTVDADEFVVNKLLDRGSLAATTIVTNVQDFIMIVAKGLGLL